MAIRQATCAQCGAEFDSHKQGQMPRYCTTQCRKEHRSVQAKMQPSKAKPPHAETCEHCGEEYLTVRRKRFCSTKCAYLGNARTCEEPDCYNPHLAKGLCRSHYAKVYPCKTIRETVACVVCGQTTTRVDDGPKRAAKYLPTCSNQCRSIMTHGLRTDLPDDHPVRWFGATCAWTPPKPKPVRFVSALCQDCDAPYILDRQANHNSGGRAYGYCSKRCRTRSGRRRRRAREHNAAGEFRWVDVIGLWLALGKCCAYCGIQSDKQPDPDHVVALSRGGDNTIDNVLPACHLCNSDKRTLTITEWTNDRHERGKPTLPHPWRSMGWRRIEQAPGDMRLDVA